MKIAITADLHLTNRSKNPERFEAFENLLANLTAMGIQHLVIAGDLFDVHQSNYTDFEVVCKSHLSINIHVIPGNHDPGISSRVIAAQNLKIYTQPELLHFDERGLNILVVPYQADKSMGEVVANSLPDLHEQDWVLVGHGDYTGSLQYRNPYEEGVYMPLTKRDVQKFLPKRVFLGHIHYPHEKDGVFYCGSPCGLDITEVGRRRFLVFDTTTFEVTSFTVNSPLIFLDEMITVLPVEDERSYLFQKAKELIKAWEIQTEEIPKVRLRVRLNGYTSDKTQLTEIIKEIFEDYHHVAEPDLSRVSNSNDLERTNIAQTVRRRISELNWTNAAVEPSSEEIFEQAMRLIYGA
ncbi:MAG: hypothetical protein A2W35_03100 [Chloroflexi bacterium RBG_16_57_11]|nr:MAG: hypothetical protein A2W35_03100 [Chloroflexi bacterium RBG_16_57_11]